MELHFMFAPTRVAATPPRRPQISSSFSAPFNTHFTYDSPSGSSSDAQSPPPRKFLPISDSSSSPSVQETENWDPLDDLFISDALSAIPDISSTQNDTQNNAPNALPEHGEATPASPYTGAFTGYYNVDMQKKPAKKAKMQEPAAKKAKPRTRTEKQVKTEPLTLEEQKKQRRRSQIASSVQRHREKKKCMVSTLQSDLKRLTEQLETLRAERKRQMNNEVLMVYQEQAMTQRRKRKQAEETNQTLKQALFQQTAFLAGMKAIMGGGELSSKELEFHDWVHSYTALASRDALARRKEYVAHFSQSKMDLAKNLVLKDTEAETQRLLATGQVYSARVRLLHDGTRNFEEMPDGLEVSMMRNLFDSAHESTRATDNAADGRVIKHFSVVLLLKETPEVNLHKLQDVAFKIMRSIGLYYPGAGYESRALDQVEVQDEGSKTTKSSVYYTGLSSTLDPTYEILDKGQNGDEVTVEARVLCREQHSRDEGMILWDYVDEDALCPFPEDKPDQKMIRRNCCGGVVVRRDPGSEMLSIRIVCSKAFCPLETPKNKTPAIANGPDAEEAQRAVARRIGLQATECDRLKNRCTKYIFRAVTSQMGVTL